MKRKLFYGTCICAGVIVGIFYACKKENADTPKLSGGVVSDTKPARRISGESTYYSKNYGGDTVYKMILIPNASGALTVNRSIYTTNRPHTVKGFNLIDNDVDYTNVYDPVDPTKLDHVSVPAPTVSSGKIYFYIPFRPGADTMSWVPTHAGDLQYHCETIGDCVPTDPCYLVPDLFGDGPAYF